MTTIGLIGLIGSGKSTVSKFMSEQGCEVIDLDKLSHRVYRKGTEAYDEILSVWDKEILDENLEIDRKKLADIIFPFKSSNKSVSELSEDLESIVWPRLETIIKKEISNKKADTIAVIEGTLILKAGFDKYCGAIWLVHSTDKNIKERHQLSKGSDFLKRFEILSPLYDATVLEDKVDQIIDNNSTKQVLYNNVQSLLESIRKDIQNGNKIK